MLTSFFRFLNLPFGGVAYDYSVYYFTALCSLLGPVARVAAAVRAPYPTHVDIDPRSATCGQEISTPNESEVSAVITLKSGVSGTAHVNADSVLEDQHFFAIYGTRGILYLPDPNGFGGEVRLLSGSARGGGKQTLGALECPFGYGDNSRGVGPAELAWSIVKDRPHRASKEMAFHVFEMMHGMLISAERTSFYEMESSFTTPEALPAGYIGSGNWTRREESALSL